MMKNDMDGTWNYWDWYYNDFTSNQKYSCINGIDYGRSWVCTGISMCGSFNTDPFWRRKITGDYWCINGICLCRNLFNATAFWINCRIYQYVVISNIYDDNFRVDDTYA